MAKLAGLSNPDHPPQWQPVPLDLSASFDRKEFDRLKDNGLVSQLHDTIASQLEDLIKANEPSRHFNNSAELRRKIDELLGGVTPAQYGRWIHYPWSGRLVHVLPQAQFRRLRTDRNRYKITPEEQDRLQSAHIGIAGLSVGSSVALTMVLEGVGSSFRLADFDTLSLSNLNRLRAGIHDLGINKAVLAARQMYELDPYLDIQLFTQGITNENIESFFMQGGALDLLIEECDDLWAKVRLREVARRHRIPVLMNTSDRGMLDVERFDREPERPLFHGVTEGLPTDMLKGLPLSERVAFFLRILDLPQLSPRIRASLIELKETIETWPQLGSAVMLGGALTTDVARRILLDKLTHSGRFYVDVEAIVRDGEEATLPQSRTETTQPQNNHQEPLALPARPSNGIGAASVDEVRYVVAHGILAPSGGNAQPWRFEWKQGQLHAILEPERSESFLDFRHSASYLAFGAVAENMDLAARDLGLLATIEPFPSASDLRLVFCLTLTRDPKVESDAEWFQWVSRRVTNRKRGHREALHVEDQQCLIDAAEERGGQLRLLTDPGLLDRIGVILGRGDRYRFTNKRLHQQMMGELRWTPAEASATRDGIDIDTLELSAATRVIFPILADWSAMACLHQIGGGKTLEQPSRNAVAGASAVGLLSAPGISPASYFGGGRAVQRVWLTANARGFAFQPMTALTYLFARLEHAAEDFSAGERTLLGELREEFLQLFPADARNTAEIMLFRVTRAETPRIRSLRRSLDETLIIRHA